MLAESGAQSKAAVFMTLLLIQPLSYLGLRQVLRCPQRDSLAHDLCLAGACMVSDGLSEPAG